MSFENTFKENILEKPIANPEKAEIIAYSVSGLKEMAVASRNKAAFLRKYELEDLALKCEAKAARFESEADDVEFLTEIQYNLQNFSLSELVSYIELVEEQIEVLDRDLLKFEDIVRYMQGEDKVAAETRKASIMKVWQDLSNVKTALLNEMVKRRTEAGESK